MQHALLDAIGADDVGGEFIAIHRQRQHARHARAVQRQRPHRQLGHRHVLQIIVEKSLDALVRGAKMVGQQPFLFAVLRDQRGKDVVKFRAVAGRATGGKPSSASLTLM